MAQYVQMHPKNPQIRFIDQAADCLREGGVIVYPTDSTYAVACCLGHQSAIQRIRRLRHLEDNHLFTLMCPDLKSLSIYAMVDNTAFRMIKSLIPGPYTFLLKATHEVPKKLLHPKRKTIGLRVPDHPITQALLAALGEPLMSTTLLLPQEDFPVIDVVEAREKLVHAVDFMIDSGPCSADSTTVIDLTVSPPVLIRQGKGDVSAYF
jgi:tRNA threonylcarbamoyl adenosine modification protein (Sua5/YciO/YrdC/YwlC family)